MNLIEDKRLAESYRKEKTPLTTRRRDESRKGTFPRKLVGFFLTFGFEKVKNLFREVTITVLFFLFHPLPLKQPPVNVPNPAPFDPALRSNLNPLSRGVKGGGEGGLTNKKKKKETQCTLHPLRPPLHLIASHPS